MRLHWRLLPVLACLAVLAKAQVPTPEAAGVGEAVAAYQHVWGTSGNPAAQPPGENRVGAQAYGYALTGPAPLTRFGLDLSYKSRGGETGFQLGVQHFTPPGYSVSAVRFGVNRSLAENLVIGLRMGVLTGNYGEYGSELLPIAEGGVSYRVTGTLRAGAHYAYVQRGFVPMAQRRLQIGVEYESSNKVSILLATTQAVSEPINGQIGLVYRPADRLQLTAGYQTLGQRVSFGSTFEIGNGLSLKVAAVIYSELPVGAAFGVSRGWGE